ncbi:aminotransferase class I/II-fold pyridoxal phosphate-dependent enzyme [Burkholderia dolosa]|uniref:Aminotransferase class I/II-fold pyridoxal phosphate-dependent enzyme n=1 Tax=Burkholderia dolosa TaxID=152500 RepID=A0A892I7H4_9BURK|nr:MULTISPECIES: aminotransferase class I/II-fold pyridoxal phosphate-dependent enzyme [Burkholderia]AJY13047.1 beta-eliminating lyase family protein [Burkholderia dolosa AU0158]MBR8420299.1 aminotransferase class I/II-fold pyridoxal phosphate-dependent enzyme [Burkholderia dolosa]MBY4658743.1 aminotransferase class I/II-fold pyridoxal phosphate-dependent enzyme [Burkholderia dolosa]MBY4689470.1 aminotransferase class I/II-fold pyridoxal phosphate-dependent enzyme [Burkholderia dolosa]MBY47807
MTSIGNFDFSVSHDDEIYKNTTGTLMMHLKRSGIRDVDIITEQMDALRQKQLREGIYSFDSFSCLGSDASSPIATSLNETPHDCSIWSTNLYLGLNRHPKVIEEVVGAVRRMGTGCGTSAISGGMNVLHRKIEAKLQHWLGKESVMLFPTGFTANMGALAALCQEDDHVLIDDESHASIRDGIRLSPARRWISFRHNSVEDLQRKLEISQRECKGKIVVIVESAYSMSGDICPLAEVVALKQRYDFLLFVDEAHSFGIYGDGGRGLCHQEGVTAQVDFIASTFSKATASIGGFVAMERRFASYFQWSANAYAFQACFTPADAAAVLAALEVIETEPGIARELHEKNRYMRSRLQRIGFDLRHSQTPIVPIYIPDTKKLLRICFDLYKNGVFSVPVAYPMVAENDGRIRFIVNVRHTREQIDHTVDLLGELASKHGLFDAQSRSVANG